MNDGTYDPKSGRPRIIIHKGRIWFTRETERRFYFILTVIMLAAGILYQLEWL